MSLTVSTDLSVTTDPGQLKTKLEDKQSALQERIRKGEPKVFGVCQIVLGLMIISYSIPLLFMETSLILNYCVPWCSGLMFIISGAAAITVEKHPKIKTLTVCLTVSVVAIIVSVIALVLYYIDIAHNPTSTCEMGDDQTCDHKFYATHTSTGVKTTISLIIMAQTAVISAFTCIVYQQRKNFTGYATVAE